MKNISRWEQLAGAALDARNALRALVPRLDHAIAAVDTSVLVEVRALAARYAESLGAALKHSAARHEHGSGGERASSRTVPLFWRERPSMHHGRCQS
jgi:hypothetical protein